MHADKLRRMEAAERTGSDEGPLPGPGGPPRQLGRYRIIAELGRGSTSIVYLAVLGGPQRFQKLFALKQLRASLAADPALSAMFLAEARLGARLSHPNVVTTLEIEADDPQPYIVMEYLDGQSMHQVVTSARVAFTPIPLHLHLAAISGAIEGLGYAHAAVGYDGIPLKVVHRDVSPHNVFITFSGLPKVLDFGIAQTSDSPNMMPPSAGRASYMSPEQAAGEVVDSRSDLFGLGVMLWEAATRKRFWSEALGKAEILRALASRTLPEARVKALANVPPDLQSLILKATSPDPADRHPSAAALQDDLQPVLRRTAPPDSAPRDLGRRMIPLFALERARLQSAIDAELEAADAEPVVRAHAPPEAAPVPLPEEASPIEWVEPDRVPFQSEPVPAVETAILSPLPTGTRSPIGRAQQWIAQHQGVVVGALALGLTIGVGISALRAHDDPAEASRAPAATATVRELAPAPAAVGVPPIKRPSTDPASGAAPAESAPSSEAARPAPSDHPVNVEALPRVWKSTRALGPRASEAAHLPDGRNGLLTGLAPATPSVAQASRVPENRATPTLPLRPIDSVNPYGP